MLPVTRSLSDVEAALALARKKHRAGAAKRLTEAKRIRTAMLREELGRGKVHRKACLAKKPQKQPILALPNIDRLAVSGDVVDLPLLARAA